MSDYISAGFRKFEQARDAFFQMLLNRLPSDWGRLRASLRKPMEYRWIYWKKQGRQI